MTNDTRVRPFAGSAHHAAFENRDCCNCVKYRHDASECDIMYALAGAAIGDGTVSMAIADRLRPTAESKPRCGEFERAESAAKVTPTTEA